MLLDVGLFALLLVGIGIAMRTLKSSSRTIFLVVGLVLVITRVGSLWYLQYREWTNTQSISYFWLVFLILPEGLLAHRLAPRMAPERTLWDVLLFTELLILGSLIIAYLFALGDARLKLHDQVPGR